MPSVFDLLDEIEKRPGLYLGWSSEEREAQLRDLQVLLMGYGHAVQLHDIEDPGRDFVLTFSQYLRDRFRWETSLGPVRSMLDHTSNESEAWDLFWKLVREFRSSLGL